MYCLAAFAVIVGACLVLVCRQTPRAQSTSATTWTVSIVLPARLVASATGDSGGSRCGRPARARNHGGPRKRPAREDGQNRASIFHRSRRMCSVLIATAAGNSAAALVDAPDVPAAGRQRLLSRRWCRSVDRFSVCGGGFRGDVDANHVTHQWRTRLRARRLRRNVMVVLASPRALPGPAKIIDRRRQVGNGTLTTTLASLHFDPPLPPLVPEKRSKLTLHVQGTDQALRIVGGKSNSRRAAIFARRPARGADVRRSRRIPPRLKCRPLPREIFRFMARILAAPDAGAARRYLTAAEVDRAQRSAACAEPESGGPAHASSRDTQKVGAKSRRFLSTTMAGDFRTLLESAAAASAVIVAKIGATRKRRSARTQDPTPSAVRAARSLFFVCGVSILDAGASGNAPCAICSSELRARPRRLSASS